MERLENDLNYKFVRMKGAIYYMGLGLKGGHIGNKINGLV